MIFCLRKWKRVLSAVIEIYTQEEIDVITEDLEIAEEATEAPATDSPLPEDIPVTETQEEVEESETPEEMEVVEVTEEVLLVVTTEPSEETVDLVETESPELPTVDVAPTTATVPVETTALAPTTANVEPTPSSIQPGTAVSVNMLPCNVAPCLNGGQCLLTAKEGWQVINFIPIYFDLNQVNLNNSW